jgi:peptide methionine sulfoxide reductase MsrA
MSVVETVTYALGCLWGANLCSWYRQLSKVLTTSQSKIRGSNDSYTSLTKVNKRTETFVKQETYANHEFKIWLWGLRTLA